MKKSSRRKTLPSRAPRAARKKPGVKRRPAKAKAERRIPTPVAVMPSAAARVGAPAAGTVAVPAGTRRNVPWSRLAVFFVFAFAAIAAGGFVIKAVDAATYTPPTQAPPGGNVPVVIWNREAATSRQTGAAIDIDGGTPDATMLSSFSVGLNAAGNDGANLGSLTTGQRLIYGAANYTGMNGSDFLLLLQTYNLGAPTSRLYVTRDGFVYAANTFYAPYLTSTTSLTAAGMSSFGSATRVLTGTQNLIYGNIDVTSAATTALLLLQNESTDRFRVDSQGRIQIGSVDTVLTGTQNLIYGNIDTASVATGSLLLLQNESADRFRVDVDGNVTAAGAVKGGSGCFGKTFVGMTLTGGPALNGVFPVSAVGSYYAADNKCKADYGPNAAVCTSEEILESISCSVPFDPIRVNGGNAAWINGGPPGYTAEANDCRGWAWAPIDGPAWGRVWLFNDTTGGRGTQTSCNAAPGLKFACCR